MAHSGDPRQFTMGLFSASGGVCGPSASSSSSAPVAGADPRVPLLNLSTVRMRMDSVQQFLSQSLDSNTLLSKDQMDVVSSEMVSAIHQIIVNGAALLACTQQNHPLQGDLPAEPAIVESADQKFPMDRPERNYPIDDPKVDQGIVDLLKDEKDDLDLDCQIVELDSVELLAEHIHFCDICGKGFKRDANLRMHMRAHGNQFKTPEALAKPENRGTDTSMTKKTRFSCPYEGCNRNKAHKKFRPLKSVICVKNHFKRSHCPKMYSCNRCNKKSFSVLSDLKSHLKQCGESKWKCSCGTSFSRKDKLFGHMALFEGHMPAVNVNDDDDKVVNEVAATEVAVAAVAEETIEEVDLMMKDDEFFTVKTSDNNFFDGLLDGFNTVDSYSFQDVFALVNGTGNGKGNTGFSDM